MPDKRRIDVMLSSTFKELQEHRRAVLEAGAIHDLNLIAQEYDGALDADLIKASLDKVDQADAYVGIIGLRYGQCPKCDQRNPSELSLAELEYRRAVERGIPRFIFLSNDDHQWPQKDIALCQAEGEASRLKRSAFVERVLKDRVAGNFASVDALEKQALITFMKFRSELHSALTADGAAERDGVANAIASQVINALVADGAKGDPAALRGAQAQIEQLRADGVIKDQAIAQFLVDFGETPLGAEQLASQLAAFSARYRDLLAKAGQGANMPAAFENERTRAREAIEAGDLDAADGILIDLEQNIAAWVDEQQEMADQGRRDRARVLWERAEIALTRLDHVSAAALFEQAGMAMPQDDTEACWSAFLRQARALGDRGELLMDRDALGAAIDVYRTRVLPLTSRTASPENWASTQNNMGAALQTLGQRGDDIALAEAVVAYRSALEVFKRDTAPGDWAMAQNNLGNALQTLGDRGSDVALAEAVAAYRAALEVFTREAAPMQWATIQNNLGAALRVLDTHGNGDRALEDSVAAYRAALEVRTRAAAPIQWAMTQNNLGNALRILGDRGDDEALAEAVTAYRASLEVFTRSMAPANWAMIQINLGAAFRVLGARGDTAALAEAVTAYRRALEICTREETPADWATTHYNLAIALGVMVERGDHLQLPTALAAARDAVSGFEQVKDVFWAQRAGELIATLESLQP